MSSYNQFGHLSKKSEFISSFEANNLSDGKSINLKLKTPEMTENNSRDQIDPNIFQKGSDSH